MAPALPAELARLKRELDQVKKGQRIAHGASIEDAAIQVHDATGSLRAIVGLQGDGTTGAVIVNGPPPPEPSAPIVASVLGGVTVSWDGQFANGAVMPLDWSRIEVHASLLPVYEPVAATLKGTIETAQGATVVVPCDAGVHIRLLARSTSGTPSVASATVGPYGPAPVVADGILDGIVTETKLAAEAVTAAKIRIGTIGADQLALGIGNLTADPSFEGPRTQALIAEAPDWTVVTPGNNSPQALHLDCTSGAITWKNLVLARLPVVPGEQHFLALDYRVSAAFNGTGAKLMFRYEDAAATVTGWGVADEPVTPGGPWARATAQVTAPVGTVTAVLMVEASEVTAGEAWFDNLEVRTLIAGGMIAAGTVTANEIAAGSIQTGHLVAEAVQAGNIAAGAVTTDHLAALAITADKIDANAITVGKIAAGAVDATAIAADAITGKTITGGTITGSLLQTATSGQRVTINEDNENLILVFDTEGRPVGELSGRGLLLAGDSGAIIYLDPDSTYPNLRFYNAAQNNQAVVNVVENTPGSANLGLNSGTFTGNGFTDMRWRTFFGEDFWVTERVRSTSASTIIGGRIDMRGTYASIGYTDSTAATQTSDTVFTPGLAKTRAKAIVEPYTGDAGTVVFVQPGPGHTGYMLRCWDPDAAKYRFSIDQSGNTTVDGTLTAGNIATGSVTITPSAAHTPTSASVTFNVTGTTVRGFATAQTTVPGSRTAATPTAAGVTGVSVSSVTSSSMLVWVNRENTTATVVNWMVIGS